MRTYSELLTLRTFDERFQYLALNGQVAQVTFGFERYLNQSFYTSTQWRNRRREIVIRDQGMDMGLSGYPINNPVIHHIVPMTPDDFETGNPMMLDPENLICVSDETHRAIHYGDGSRLRRPFVERAPGDTREW